MTERNRERFNSYLMGKKPDWEKKTAWIFFFLVESSLFWHWSCILYYIGYNWKSKVKERERGRERDFKGDNVNMPSMFFLSCPLLIWLWTYDMRYFNYVQCWPQEWSLGLPCRLNLPPDLCKGWCLSQKRLSHKYKIYS